MKFDLKARTILLTLAGSHAYGTARSGSDVDIKGVCVPPQRYRDGFVDQFQQATAAEHMAPFLGLLKLSHLGSIVGQAARENGLEGTIYEVRKFFKLAADANPNILDILFCNPDDVILSTSVGLLLRRHRDLFLSKKVAHTFRGYAMAQLKRIRTHRQWLLTPPSAKPTRKDYNLPEHTLLPKDQIEVVEAAVQKKLDSWELDLSGIEHSVRGHILEMLQKHLAEMEIGQDEKWRAAARHVGASEDVIKTMERERRYRSAKREWDRYQNWVKTRNPVRAALEAAHGMDTKHAHHLVRLLRMCREILAEGIVLVRRPDAADLLAIRDGAWSYDRLIGWAEEQDAELLELVKTSELPQHPPMQQLNDLCLDVVYQI